MLFGARYVGRPTMFGNPFEVNSTLGPAGCVEAYRSWLRQPAQGTLVVMAGRMLRGRDLACWCAPWEPCHADVLLEVANT
jgi:hypothetical protein